MGQFTKAVARYLWQVLLNVHEATNRWRDDDAGLLAAGVAFFATISMVPLLLVLIAGFSLFLCYTSLGQDAELDVLVAIEAATSSEVADSVSIALAQVQEQAAIGGPLGVVGLIAAAMAVFGRFDRALAMIWKSERRRRTTTSDTTGNSKWGSARVVGSMVWGSAWDLMLHRIKAFATLLGLGLVVLTIFGADMAITAVSKFSESRLPAWEWIWHVAKMATSVALNACVFGLIYRLLGRSRIDWRRALRGGLLAAVTWEAGRLVLAEFLIDDRYTAYGMVGSLLVLMMWAYYATSVLLLGAEYVQVIRERESVGLRASPPSDSAVAPADVDAPELHRILALDHGFRRWRPGRRQAKAA